jgi:hypothetical protein
VDRFSLVQLDAPAIAADAKAGAAELVSRAHI